MVFWPTRSIARIFGTLRRLTQGVSSNVRLRSGPFDVEAVADGGICGGGRFGPGGGMHVVAEDKGPAAAVGASAAC